MKRIIFPGTFDPIHYGHIDIASRSLKLFDELVIAVYDKPLKNLLFSPQERIALTKEAFMDDPRVRVEGYSGLTITYAKSIGACAILRGLRVFSDFEYEFRMALANKRLDPDVEVVALITSELHTFLSSTTVKEIAALGGDVSTMVPPHVAIAMEKKFLDLGEGQNIVPLTSMRD
jgi:pantetheine-phosphate adenylyltransferase